MTKNYISKIPNALYNKITRLLPIACVDVVVVLDKKFLLGKRINEPAKNE